MNNTTEIQVSSNFLVRKLKDYMALTKFRLSFTVMISASLGYLFGIDYLSFNWLNLILFSIGGLIVTFSSNILNEIIEKESDKLMERTKLRPLPTSTMSVSEALLAAGVFGVGGISLLAYQFSPLVGLLAAISLLSYAFLYTPLKKITSFSVFVGAISGALPTAIGYIAATNSSIENLHTATLLFFIQFLWQFPHFWSIAWLRFDEYKNAGIMMLPSPSGKTKASAIQAFIYTAVLLIVSMIPYFYGMINWIAGLVILCTGMFFMWYAFVFYSKCEDAAAKKLMFFSFAYLPIVQLAMVLGRVA